MFAAILAVIATLMFGFSVSMKVMHSAEHRKAGYAFQIANRAAQGALTRDLLSQAHVDSLGIPVPPSPTTNGGVPAFVSVKTDAWKRPLHYCGYDYSVQPLPAGQLPRTGLIDRRGSPYTGSVIAVVVSDGANRVADLSCTEALQAADTGTPLRGDDVLYALITASTFRQHGEAASGNPYFKDPVDTLTELALVQGGQDGEVRYVIAENVPYSWSAVQAKWSKILIPNSQPYSGNCPDEWVKVPATTLPSGVYVPEFCVTSGEVQTSLAGTNDSYQVRPSAIAKGVSVSTGELAIPTPHPYERSKEICEWFSGESQLIQSQQWDALVYRVGQDKRNWTDGQAGRGEIIRGISENGGGDDAPNFYGYRQPSIIGGVCAPNSTRTPHVDERVACLADQAITDLSGNLPEWVELTASKDELPLPVAGFCLVDAPGGCESSWQGLTSMADISRMFNKVGIWGVTAGTGYYAVAGATPVLAAQRGGGTQVGSKNSPAFNYADTRPFGPNSLEFTDTTALAGVRCTRPVPR